MRLAARVDENHAAIVAAIRKCGMTVQSLAALGKGCPDILVGESGRNWLFEIKNDKKCKSEKALTKDEERFHEKWKGQVAVVETVFDILMIIGKDR